MRFPKTLFLDKSEIVRCVFPKHASGRSEIARCVFPTQFSGKSEIARCVSPKHFSGKSEIVRCVFPKHISRKSEVVRCVFPKHISRNSRFSKKCFGKTHLTISLFPDPGTPKRSWELFPQKVFWENTSHISLFPHCDILSQKFEYIFYGLSIDCTPY